MTRDQARQCAEQHAAYQKAMRKRAVWVEPLFGEAKDWHGLRCFRLRSLWKVNAEALLIASGQNLKRLLCQQGWGRRPWLSGAPATMRERLLLRRCTLASHAEPPAAHDSDGLARTTAACPPTGVFNRLGEFPDR